VDKENEVSRAAGGSVHHKMREVSWLAEGRKEERKKGRRKGSASVAGEIRSSGIMEFLSPLEARH